MYSYNTGTVSCSTATNVGPIIGFGGDSGIPIEYCYYLDSCCSGGSNTYGTSKGEGEMTVESFVGTLNDEKDNCKSYVTVKGSSSVGYTYATLTFSYDLSTWTSSDTYPIFAE